MRVRVGESFDAMTGRVLASVAGENGGENLNFESWAVLCREVAKHDPAMAERLRAMPEADREAVLEEPSFLAVCAVIVADQAL
ncbi:MAG TPA: hypothetical protein VGN80_17280 [Devosiaceae bacterium]|jgi:hypothetical protein|nr:hypothetical protein [Devosiaceae bacterium]